MIRYRIVRYLFAGSITTLLMLGLLKLGTMIGIHYLFATSLAFIITIPASFLIHKYWTFQNKERRFLFQFGSHSVLTVCNFFFNIALMYFFVNLVSLSTSFSQLLASGFIAIETFLLYRMKIFTHTDPTENLMV